jgi:hypothetical protein
MIIYKTHNKLPVVDTSPGSNKTVQVRFIFIGILYNNHDHNPSYSTAYEQYARYMKLTLTIIIITIIVQNNNNRPGGAGITPYIYHNTGY